MTSAWMAHLGPTIPRPEMLTDALFMGAAKSLILLVTKLPVFAGEASGAFNSAGWVIMAPGVSLHRWTRIRHAAEQNLRERPRADCVTVLSHSALRKAFHS
jgi:hypothetical protein